MCKTRFITFEGLYPQLPWKNKNIEIPLKTCVFRVHVNSDFMCLLYIYWYHENANNMKNHLKMCKMRFTAFGRASPQLGTSNPQLYCDPSKSKKTVANMCISRSLHLRMSMDYWYFISCEFETCIKTIWKCAKSVLPLSGERALNSIMY